MTLNRSSLTDSDGTPETGTVLVDDWWQTDLWAKIELAINKVGTQGAGLTVSTSNQNATVTAVSCAALFYDATTGVIAFVLYQIGVTPVTIVSQVGSTFVTGVPGAAEIQITESGSRLVAKGGSSRVGDTLRVTYFPL